MAQVDVVGFYYKLVPMIGLPGTVVGAGPTPQPRASNGRALLAGRSFAMCSGDGRVTGPLLPLRSKRAPARGEPAEAS
jgi:hypothetical protein